MNKSPVLKEWFDKKNSRGCDFSTFTATKIFATERSVRLLVQGLYSQKLVGVSSSVPFADRQDIEDDLDGEMGDLVDMWLLAEKLELPEIQNLALESLENLMKYSSFASPPYFPVDRLHNIYQNTDEEEHPLRRYLVAAAVGCISFYAYDDEDKKQYFPLEFVMEMYGHLSGLSEKQAGFNRDYKVSDFFVSK